MTLRDEIAADSRPRGEGCSVCAWLATRPADEDWAAILADSGLTHKGIFRAMQRRGYDRHSSKPLEQHRNDGHDPRGD